MKINISQNTRTFSALSGETLRPFACVYLIGVGLIGGSFALALKQRGLAQRVIGIDQSTDHLTTAEQMEVIDAGASLADLSGLIKDQLKHSKREDLLIMIATPVVAMESIFLHLRDAGLEDLLISDVGSTKQSVIAAARAAFTTLPKGFIPGHPIAGKEHTGVSHADADLFCDHKVILTPDTSSCPQAIARIATLWQSVGAQVDTMDARTHDHILAATSHLPHILAYALVDSLVATPEETAIFAYAAGGFKSLTRTASSNPVMWRDICLRNADEILLWLNRYQQKLSHLQTLIEHADAAQLEALFTQAKSLRDTHLVNDSASQPHLPTSPHA